MKKLDSNQLSFLKKKEDTEKAERQKAKLEARFSDDAPFIVKYKPLRGVALVASYIFNIISAAGIMYVVKVFFEALPSWASWSLGIAGLILFEIAKRKFSDIFWDEFHSTRKINYLTGFINFVLLFGISLAGTGFGLYFVSIDTDPGAAALRAEITKVENKIAHYEGQKNPQGIIYWNVQHDILPPLHKNLSNLKKELADVTKSSSGTKNATAATDATYFKTKGNFRTYGGVGLSILFEILFEICMSFMSRYDYMLLMAMTLLSKSSSSINGTMYKINGSTPTQSQNQFGANMSHSKTDPIGFNVDKDGNIIVATSSNRCSTHFQPKSNPDYQLEIKRLKQAYKNAQSQHGAWRAKLAKGEGKPATNTRHMKRLEKEMQDIAFEIQELERAEV